MAEIRLSYDVQFRDELGRFATAVDEGANRATIALAEEGANLSRAFEAPHSKTGRTYASIHSYVLGFLHAGWGAGGAARFLEFGTRPHDEGVRGKYYRVGRGVAAGPVHHPGARPYPFMEPARAIIRAKAPAVYRAFLP